VVLEGDSMIECPKCGIKVKTSQALRGHMQFKHSDFVPLKIKKKKSERILIGNKVIAINDLRLDIDSAAKLKEFALEMKLSVEESVDVLLRNREMFLELSRKTRDFEYIECVNCNEYSWMPKEEVLDDLTTYCVWCGRGQV